MIPLYSAFVPPSVSSRLGQVLDDPQHLAFGPACDAFEQAVGAAVESPHFVCCSDVDRAMQIALRLGNAAAGDVVLASPLACLSTLSSAAELGLRFCWFDLDPITLAPVVGGDDDALAERARVAIVYHFAGRPCDMDYMLGASRERGWWLIEDASESWGARTCGRAVGSCTADATVFSFYPNKALAAVEGGGISLLNSEHAGRARRLRRYGIDFSTFRSGDGEINTCSDIPESGMNAALPSIHAAWGLDHLRYAADLVERHRANANRLRAGLLGLPGVTLLQDCGNATPSHWTYALRVERRSDFVRALRGRGVQSGRMHVLLDSYTAFRTKALNSSSELPGLRTLDRELVCIPCGWWLENAQVEQVIAAARAGW